MTQPHHDPVLYAQSFLTDRDHRLLDWLYDHQVLSTAQITAALFNRQDAAQERLLRLYRLRLLERFRSARLASAGWHHVLDQAGVELVAALRGDAVPRRVDITAQRRRIAASANLPHLFGVNQFFVDLIAYARRRPGDALLRWWSERQCAAPLRFGSVSMHRVRADAGGEGAAVRAAVTEGGPAWPVLFSLPDHTREEHLHKALGRQPRAVPVATVARDRLMDGTGVADAVWLPTGAAGVPEPPRRLIDLGRLGDPADDSALLRLDRRPLAQ